MLIALAIWAAYTAPMLITWRRAAWRRWQWTERAHELRSARSPEVWAHLGEGRARGWDGQDSRVRVMASEGLWSALWPLGVVLTAMHYTAEGLAHLLTMPPRRERQRRRLARARQRVAELEHELDIAPRTRAR